MDSSNMILLKGEIKTAEIEAINEDKKGVYWVRFKSGKSFPYSPHDVCVLSNPKEIDVADCRISNKMGATFHPTHVWEYKHRFHRYYRIEFPDGKVNEYDEKYLTVKKSVLKVEEAANTFNYLKDVSAMQVIITDNGPVSLHDKYEKIDFIDEDCALASYLLPKTLKTYKGINHLLFPFYSNLSQMQAVDNAFKSQVSVIQGPPGTGKTQTILNIVANIISRKKTVLIVSNNNSAVENVKEKLEKEGLGFVVAELGKSENRNEFIAKGQTKYPDMSSWEDGQAKETLGVIDETSKELSSIFEKQNKLAEDKQELDALRIEKQHFYEENNYDKNRLEDFEPIASDKLVNMWVRLDIKNEGAAESTTWWSRLKKFFLDKISAYRMKKTFGKQVGSKSDDEILMDIKALFYQVREQELTSEISSLETYLADKQAKTLLKKQASLSMQTLKASLYVIYEGGAKERRKFTAQDLWKCSDDVAKEYPVVLSTTYSALTSLPGHVFDYLIMDEASQVPVESAALAMKCAQNVIIVGDLKQLPNIITDDVKEKVEPINKTYKIDDKYNCLANSFLSSIIKVFPKAPQTLLREHYRCAPMIINFCNQKYYGGELVIMTDSAEDSMPMQVIKTVPGNHSRGIKVEDKVLVTNQREVDELTNLLTAHPDADLAKVGVVTPYRAQADLVHRTIHDDRLEADTIHKYQGREKDVIIMSTVADKYNDFVDDANLINVAVSRAKKEFVLITNGNENPKGNISDLIDYVEYNHGEVINSHLHSIFDLLYASYAEQRAAYLQGKGTVSEYDSENIAFNVINAVLKRNNEMANLEVKPHYHLNALINDVSLLTDEETKFTRASWSHVDFLIENRVSKQPVLVIEVDGFAYHHKGTKQEERDRLKDSILNKYRIPMLRLSTAGSGEVDKIETELNSVLVISKSHKENH